MQVAPEYQSMRTVLENHALKASAETLQTRSAADIANRAQQCDAHNPDGLWVSGSSWPPRELNPTSEGKKPAKKISTSPMRTICEYAVSFDEECALPSSSIK